ncbi:zinc finger, C4 type, partial [Ostertagia ostertagi]
GSEEFSVTTLLCQVCSDKASGFHYGVFACEGCKISYPFAFLEKVVETGKEPFSLEYAMRLTWQRLVERLEL